MSKKLHGKIDFNTTKVLFKLELTRRGRERMLNFNTTKVLFKHIDAVSDLMQT